VSAHGDSSNRGKRPGTYPTPESNGVSDSAESSVIIIAKQLDELQLRCWTLRRRVYRFDNPVQVGCSCGHCWRPGTTTAIFRRVK
jgi:hypothetical protein